MSPTSSPAHEQSRAKLGDMTLSETDLAHVWAAPATGIAANV